MDLSEITSDRTELERQLEALGCMVRGNNTTCPDPGHVDHNPSASIHDRGRDHWTVTCHRCNRSWDAVDLQAMAKGCEPADVLRELREGQEQQPRQPKRQQASTPKVYPDLAALRAAFKGATIFEYRRPGTHDLDLAVIRIEHQDGKRFLQGHQGREGIVLRAPEGMLPIYNRTRVLGADVVVVAEGEKAVHALHAAGHVATTSPGGAGKAHLADWSPLAGKRVVLWPDHDEPGAKHMDDVAGILSRLRPAPRVYRIDPEKLNLPHKGDAADFLSVIEREQGPESLHGAVVDVLSEAKELCSSRPLLERINAAASGALDAASWPWQAMERLTGGLRLGTVTVLVGSPGASKSLMLFQAMSYWIREGMPAALLALEEGADFHLARVAAQESATPGVTDDRWLRTHAEQARSLYLKHQPHLDAVGSSLWAGVKPKDMTIRYVLEWVEARMAEGRKLVAVDPVSILDRGNAPWEADRQLFTGLETLAEQYRAAVVVVAHPSKSDGKQAPSLDGIAGGAVVQRVAQCVVWLEACDPTSVEVNTPGGRLHAEINRKMHLLKTRSGSGARCILGAWFQGEDLRMIERGILIPKRGGR